MRRRETHSKIVIVGISELFEHIIDKNVFLITFIVSTSSRHIHVHIPRGVILQHKT